MVLGATMKKFSQFLIESKVENHPKEKMREYSKSELDWEYHTEYEKYSKPSFPHAFTSREHFQHEYDKAPLHHMSHDEYHNLQNHTKYNVKKPEDIHKEPYLAGRRDTKRIEKDLLHGKTAPPIVLKHKGGLHLMAGNTRLSVGRAHGKNIPVKRIDISDRH
jgi:hypothetical protein